MTTMTIDPAVSAAATTASRPTLTARRTTSPKTAALIAGVGYVLLFALAIFANFLVLESMVVTDDPSATFDNIASSTGLFRLGLVAFLAVFVIDIAVAWALHVVFRGHDPDLSLLAAWARLGYTVFLGVAVMEFFEVLHIVDDPTRVATLGRAQAELQVTAALESFDALWLMGLVAFGLHLVLLGSMIIRTGLGSRLMGVIVAIAGVTYAIDTIANATMPNYEAYSGAFLAMVAIPSMIGEGWVGLWLLSKARSNKPATPLPTQQPTGA